MAKFTVTIEDVSGSDTSEATAMDFDAAVLASMRRAAQVAVEAIQVQSGHHTVLVQVRDAETGKLAVVEFMISALVTLDVEPRH